MPKILLPILWLLFALAGCAGMPGSEPLNVTLVGVESLPGEGMEVRMAVKLRIQNPNDRPVDYDGLSLSLELRGLDFATGMSDVQGSVPRFGEAVLVVPVTVSALAMARQIYGFAARDRSALAFVARGRLAGSGFGGMRFESRGEFDLPAGTAVPAPPRN
jgi:LEA14-like dessication related protein